MGFVDFCGDDVANQVDSTRANHSIFSKRDMQPLQYIKRAAPTWAARLIFRNFDFAMFMEGFGTSRTFSCTKSGERGDSEVVN